MRWLLSSAVLLAVGMIAAGVMAGSTIRARDAAVREGILLRAGHDLERRLREEGPADSARLLESSLGSHASAVELWAGDRLLGRAGAPRGEALEMPLSLGPSWRGMGTGGLGFGRGGTRSPFRLRLWPAAGVGESPAMAAFTAGGSVAAAIALLAFAAFGARGVEARQRAAILDAERRRLEVVSAAGAGLAHRIRNPLATIKATAQLLERQLDGPAGERARRIVDAGTRIEALIQELLMFARPVDVIREEIELAAAARSVTDNVSGAGPLAVTADREHVLAAIEELVANARQAGDGDPEVVVRRQGRHAVVEVRDRGAGLQVDAARAFDPYVTTRPDGSGLGLPTVRALIRANGGEVTLAPRDGGGCVATILLPAVSA